MKHALLIFKQLKFPKTLDHHISGKKPAQTIKKHLIVQIQKYVPTQLLMYKNPSQNSKWSGEKNINQFGLVMCTLFVCEISTLMHNFSAELEQNRHFLPLQHTKGDFFKGIQCWVFHQIASPGPNLVFFLTFLYLSESIGGQHTFSFLVLFFQEWLVCSGPVMLKLFNRLESS